MGSCSLRAFFEPGSLCAAGGTQKVPLSIDRGVLAALPCRWGLNLGLLRGRVPFCLAAGFGSRARLFRRLAAVCSVVVYMGQVALSLSGRSLVRYRGLGLAITEQRRPFLSVHRLPRREPPSCAPQLSRTGALGARNLPNPWRKRATALRVSRSLPLFERTKLHVCSSPQCQLSLPPSECRHTTQFPGVSWYAYIIMERSVDHSRGCIW